MKIKDEPHPIRSVAGIIFVVWSVAEIIFVDEEKGVAGVKLSHGADEIALDRLEKLEKSD